MRAMQIQRLNAGPGPVTGTQLSDTVRTELIQRAASASSAEVAARARALGDQSLREGLSTAQTQLSTPAVAEEGARAPERPGDAWVVVNPHILIGEGALAMPLGHTSLVTFSDAPGGARRARLTEFGAYDDNGGHVRHVDIPIDLQLDPATGDLSAGSREALMQWLSKYAVPSDGGQRVEVTEVENIDLDKLDAFVEDFEARRAQGEVPYQLIGNNCTTFAWQAVHAGSVSELERAELYDRGDWEGLSPRPNQGLLGKLHDVFDTIGALPDFSNDGMSDRFTQYAFEAPERTEGRERGGKTGAAIGTVIGAGLGAAIPVIGPLMGPALGSAGGLVGWLWGNYIGDQAAR